LTARRRLALRAGLAFSPSPGVAGVWGLLFARAFYNDFPLPGHDWVAMLPPYWPGQASKRARPAVFLIVEGR
jgi:hypothetical protein